MLIDIILKELFEHFDINAFVHVEINAIPDEEWGHDLAEAYCGCEDDGEYLIEYKASLIEDANAFLSMICHECVHIAQDLAGVHMDYSLPYNEQPHEIEAYDMQEWLVMHLAIKP